jgi:GT2 family glycosyltransferase
MGSSTRMGLAFTVTIASHRRRDSLVRLVQALGPEVVAVQHAGGRPEVIVVLDGCDDGSREALSAMDVPFPLTVVSQPHRGLAAARNAGLNRADPSGVVLFLDDDLTPSAGLLLHHYRFHTLCTGQVMAGPCRPAVDAASDRTAPEDRSAWHEWWAAHYRRLAAAGAVLRADQFTAANASGAVSLLTSVGGFDETFTGYGGEDHELGARLLGAGVPIRFDREAVAWHHSEPAPLEAVRRERSSGANRVLIVALHPELTATMFPSGPRSLAKRMVGLLPGRSARTFWVVSQAAAWAGLRHPTLLAGRTSLATQVAHCAAFAAGVADADPSYVDLYLDLRRLSRSSLRLPCLSSDGRPPRSP